MSEISNTILRLRSKTSQLPVKGRYLCVYDNEILLGRRAKAIKAGQIVQFQSADRVPIVTAAFNAKSKITLLILDLKPNQNVEVYWITLKIKVAVDLCGRIFEELFYWLVHEAADGLHGAIIDRFRDICVIQPNAAWAERYFTIIWNAAEIVVPLNIMVKNTSGRGRQREGLEDERVVITGTWPDAPIPVAMNGAIYMADLASGQRKNCSLLNGQTMPLSRALQKGQGLWAFFLMTADLASRYLLVAIAPHLRLMDLRPHWSPRDKGRKRWALKIYS